MQGHEDDTLLNFFPNGFIIHDGERQEAIGNRMGLLNNSGCLFKVMGPYGETPLAV